MKALKIATLFLIGSIIFIGLGGCKKVLPEPTLKMPTSDSGLSTFCCLYAPLMITPTSGPGTTLVTLWNRNFGTVQSAVKVTFNDKPARIVSFSSTRVVAEVPLRAGTGPVKVSINDITTVGPIFNYAWISTVSTIVVPGSATPTGITIVGDKIYFSTAGDRCQIWTVSNIYGSTHTFKKVAGAAEGYLDGNAWDARFRTPRGIEMDKNGILIIADTYNHKVRRFNPNNLMVNTMIGNPGGFADGNTSIAKVYHPNDIAIDALNNIYIADMWNHRIRKVSPSGIVSTLGGSGVKGFADGTGTTARFNNPTGVAVDASGNVYVADYYGHRIRKVTPSGTVSTLAGDGTAGYRDGAGASARFNFPIYLAIDKLGNILVGDSKNNRVRSITPSGVVSTVAGSGVRGSTDGDASIAQFNNACAIITDKDDNIWLTTGDAGKLRKITIQ